uniref:Transmembrane protein n=1 Tax=Ananas comosus var. bracteatus TaxID=296719 RepID=A0A6V7PU91_ANACO|nr:unnamed protein product [Ananas comosus var. bracteatus]
MAWNFSPSSPLPTSPLRIQTLERFPTRSHSIPLRPHSSPEKHFCPCKAVQSEGVREEPSLAESSARTQLDLLEQLTSSTSNVSGPISINEPQPPTIREQLSELTGDRNDDFMIPLGKKLKASINSLTISQRRNIKRRAYLNEVARRDDSVFFATIGAFVILPPFVILAIAVLTGYVELFP